jgi:uncharacterized protein YyaL (SSP411 family)
MRDMTDAGGGFYSAEDADSIPPEHAADPDAHKMEGAFYIWTDAEVAALLGADAEIARRRYGIERDGNAPQDPQGEFTGKNLLYTVETVDEIAARLRIPVQQVEEALVRCRAALFAARSTRPRPHLDDKVLTAWNGLMIAAFARAARVLPDSPNAGVYLDAARSAAGFIRTRLWNGESGQLLRRYRKGEAGIPAYAEDYAFMIFGILELFQADGDARWLEWSGALQRAQDDRFWDATDGGWFSTTGDDPTVLLRLKEDYDGAEPAASSISVLNLLTLAHLVPQDDALRRAERTLARLGERIGAAARAVPMMLCALSAWHHGSSQIVVVASPGAEEGRALKRELAAHYLPFAIVIPVTPGPAQAAVSRHLEFVREMTPRTGAAAYVCRDFACQQPVSRPAELAELLAQAAVGGV